MSKLEVDKDTSQAASAPEMDPEEAKEPQETVPEEPYTVFKKSQLVFFLSICAVTGMISPLTASVYLPALNAIEEVTITVSTSATFNDLLGFTHINRTCESYSYCVCNFPGNITNLLGYNCRQLWQKTCFYGNNDCVLRCMYRISVIQELRFVDRL